MKLLFTSYVKYLCLDFNHLKTFLIDGNGDTGYVGLVIQFDLELDYEKL